MAQNSRDNQSVVLTRAEARAVRVTMLQNKHRHPENDATPLGWRLARKPHRHEAFVRKYRLLKAGLVNKHEPGEP